MAENLPIYKQIVKYIEDCIENNIYQKGNIIPTEKEFCNQFNPE
jgi:GntR family transcriptional regulator